MSASSGSEAESTKTSLTEKEARLLKVCMDNLTDGRAGLLKQVKEAATILRFD